MSVYLSRSPYFMESRPARRAIFRRSKSGGNGSRSHYSRKRRNGFVLGVDTVKDGMKRAQRIFRGVFTESSATVSAAAKALKDVKGGKVNYEIGPRTIMIGLGIIAIGLSLTYLAHFNQVATKGYDLRRLEVDRQQLLNQHEIKNMRLAEVMSLNAIANSEKADAMRRPGETVYLRGNTALASR